MPSTILYMHCYLFNLPRGVRDQQNSVRPESRGRSVVGSEPVSLEDVFHAFPEPAGRTGDRGLVHGDLRHLPHLHSHKELWGACQPGGVRGSGKGETLGSRIQGPVAHLGNTV